jgi:hypothetical protein
MALPYEEALLGRGWLISGISGIPSILRVSLASLSLSRLNYNAHLNWSVGAVAPSVALPRSKFTPS